ncbi:MAG: hypothetical protein J6I48_04995 [Lachnospira sp.]|nr:hypothetical protein [Lachnospira sp.]
MQSLERIKNHHEDEAELMSNNCIDFSYKSFSNKTILYLNGERLLSYEAEDEDISSLRHAIDNDSSYY